MPFLSFVKIISLLLALVAAAMLIPAGFALYYGEYPMLVNFLSPVAAAWTIALVILLATRGKKISVSIKGGYIVAASCWAFASILGMIPLALSGYFSGIADALFESVSGFSTTGATVLTDIDSLPISLNVWRCEMHWLGGMGILALAVALLPLLGIGGFQLFKAETPGPEKIKMTPKIATTAKILWLIYLGFTSAQTVLLMLAGMNFPDALSHAFSVAASGGFSTKTASIGYFNSAAIEMICAVFMILATINFTMYFYLFTGKIREAVQNTETKAYLLIIASASLFLAFVNKPFFGSFARSLESSFFHAVSVVSTTGFSSSDFAAWFPAGQMTVLILLLVGGASGSTAGGIKVIRWTVLFKQVANQVRSLLHPHGVFTVQINKRSGRRDIVYSVVAFMFLYVALAALTTFVAALDGADPITALSGALALVGNEGPGLGRVGPSGNYAFFSAPVKFFFCAAMLAGRLELYTLVMLCLPSFWRKQH
jgi:trk system potassium uptake protein TrkH